MAYTLDIMSEEKVRDVSGHSAVVGEHARLVSAFILCLVTCNL